RMKNLQIAGCHRFRKEKIAGPLRLGALITGGTAEDRQWSISRQRTASDFNDTPAGKVELFPAYVASGNRLVAQKMLGITDATDMLGGLQQFICRPGRSGTQHGQPSPEQPPG